MTVNWTQPPIWSFGVVAIILASTLYLSNIIPIRVALALTVFVGLPTWFIGSIIFGIKADKLLGAEGAFNYETLPNQKSEKSE